MNGEEIEGPRSAARAKRSSGLIRAALSFLAFIGMVMALSLAIVLPLWSLATWNRRAYSMAVAGVLALGLLFLGGRALRRAGRLRGRRLP
jgi:hypothetical protein